MALGGGLVLAVALRWQVPGLTLPALWPGVLLALAVVAAELRPLRLAERRISLSSAPALALVLSGPLALGMLALALPVLVDDLRRGSWLRGLFTAGQCVLALAAARAVFALGTGTGMLDLTGHVGAGELPWALLAGLAFVAVTVLAPAVAVTVRGGLPPLLVLAEAVRGSGPGLVPAAVAPAIAVLALTVPATLPLLLLAVAGMARWRPAGDGVDPLTGLPGRPLLADRVTGALAADGRAALLLVDLLNLVEVNDTLGHGTGDELLVRTAARLRPAMPERAALLRRGPGFAVVVPGMDVAAATALAGRLVALVAEPAGTPGERVEVRAGVGVAVAPGHGATADELLRAAGVARHRAGRSRSSVEVSGAGAGQRAGLRRSLVDDLLGAIDNEEFELLYQPQVARDGSVLAVEALLRWRHPRLGTIEPAVFIPIADNTGLIGRLSRRALESALITLGLLRGAGHDLSLSLNLSARTLADLDLPTWIARSLLVSSVPPSRLTVEVPEATLTANPARTIEVLHALRESGVRIALDDYGTGWSPLATLRRLQPDELKLDRTYVGRVATDAESADVVRAAVTLARSLGLDVVAIGVEDQATLDVVTALGCDRLQGFHIARPMLPAALKTWLDTAALHGGHIPAVPLPALPPPIRR